MTDEELKAIEERANAATPGPWEAELDGYAKHYPEYADNFTEICGPEGQAVVCGDGGSIGRMVNGQFMAHAREDIPRLITEIRFLRMRLDEE